MKIFFAVLLLAGTLICMPPAGYALDEAVNESQNSESIGYGTSKTGDFTVTWQPSWIPVGEKKIILNPFMILTVLLLVLFSLGIFALIRGIYFTVKENGSLNSEIQKQAKKTKVSDRKFFTLKDKKKGMGLRFKLAIYTIVLVLLVIFMISAPLYYLTTKSRELTLFSSLWDRSAALLEGLATSTNAYLLSDNTLGLSMLPSEVNAIPEAKYITITSCPRETAVYEDFVWATNDPDILSKIDTPELITGVSRLYDNISPRLDKIRGNFEIEARDKVKHPLQRIHDLSMQKKLLTQFPEPDYFKRVDEIDSTIQSLENSISKILADIIWHPESEPEYKFTYSPRGNMHFILYKPIMYRSSDYSGYFHGLIRLSISIETLVEELHNEILLVFRTIMLIAFAALAIGIIGALMLSTLLIMPISKLVHHVELIRDTEDKMDLAGRDIHIASRDEIAVLGDTINEMTHGLVKAADVASELLIGKEIQEKFLPLDIDEKGKKLNSGYSETENAVFFGYYEGAAVISGVYFDYRNLDGRYYAVIKCDVAGKGIPAALLMIQVATMFLNYFNQWKPDVNGTHIEEIVYQINNFMEKLGLQGRFAAFTLCLFDSQNGNFYFCNAGDNIIRIIDSSEKRLKTITLPESPAVGILTNGMVDSRGGYKVQTVTLDHGDILLLYTDGIEDIKRKYRDTDQDNFFTGKFSEELGMERVHEIVNAVINRQLYTLCKKNDPEEDEILEFDFSGCKGDVDEIIIALVSAGKIFRCYLDPSASAEDRVSVDIKVDDFLKARFLQYDKYCSNITKIPGSNTKIYYTHLKEDEQFDDITLLGIKRK